MILSAHFKKLRWYFKVFKYFLEKEKSYHSRDVPFSDKLWLWRNGFNSYSNALEGINKSNFHLYLDTIRYKKHHRDYNGIFHTTIDNKAMLPFIFPESLIPEDYFIFEKGTFIGSNVHIEESAEEYLSRKITEKAFIYKPVFSSLGVGVIELNRENFKRVTGFAKTKKRTFVICEKVQNHAYSDTIFSGSTNTIRFHLIRDPSTRKFFIYDAIHKFGTRKSSPADNWSKGGCYFHIDKETGRIGSGFVKVVDKKIKTIKNHPDTGTQITGVKIPKWKEHTDSLLAALNKKMWLRYTGLDAVLTGQGFKIIELNSLPDMDGLQAEKPIFSDSGAAAFFASVGIYPKTKIRQ